MQDYESVTTSVFDSCRITEEFRAAGFVQSF